MKRVTILLALLSAAASVVGARDLVIHGAVYNIRTDVGIGAFVEADSFVLVYACDEAEEEGIRLWLGEYSVFDIDWRRNLESTFAVDLLGFTLPVSNSRSPSWDETVGIGKTKGLLLLFVDEDIQFDDPFGFVFVQIASMKAEELWIDGVGSYESQRIGKVTLTVR